MKYFRAYLPWLKRSDTCGAAEAAENIENIDRKARIMKSGLDEADRLENLGRIPSKGMPMCFDGMPASRAIWEQRILDWGKRAEMRKPNYSGKYVAA